MARKQFERGTQVGRPSVLTRDQVVDAAISLVDEVGLEGLSMPKLGRRLDVGTMTIYGYVESKEHLLDLMAERMFEDLVVGDGPDPQVRMMRFFDDFRGAALAHPALAQLLAGGRITIPAVFDTLESTIGPLVASGWDADDAVRVFYAALAYTLGFVLWEIPRSRQQPGTEYATQWRDLMAGLDPAVYPTVTGAASETLVTTASDDQFEWGLRRVIEGG